MSTKKRKLNTLEKALIDEIDMVLDSYYDRYVTNLDLSNEQKLKICHNIISYNDEIWSELNDVIINYINKFYEKRYEYLKNKHEVCCEIDSKEEYELQSLKTWYEDYR